MAKNQLSFFSSKSDLSDLLNGILQSNHFQFVQTGLFDVSTHEKISISTIINETENLKYGDMNFTPNYLVMKEGYEIKIRTVGQRNGGMKYAVDQLENPKSISFRPSGIFSNQCIVSGQIGTATNDEESIMIYKIFNKEIHKQFFKIKSFYVGKNASTLLSEGWRLTTNVKSPQEYDLKK